MADNLQTREAMLAGLQQDETRVEMVQGEARAREVLAANVTSGTAAHRSIQQGPPYFAGGVSVGAAIRAMLAFAAPPAGEREGVPADVRRLVIAARMVAFDGDCDETKLRELDQASEAFADRVPWEDEPGA